MPHLRKVDLARAYKHECPGIKIDEHCYLIKYDSRYYAGTFGREWYGLCFDGFPSACSALQFDAPGYNSSRWEGVWAIVDNS